VSRDAALVVVVGAIVLVVAVVIGLGAFGTTTTTTTSGPATVPPDPPPGGTTGVTFELRTEPGTSILGLKLRADKHYAFVALAAPQACIDENEDGSPDLSAEASCANLAAHGEIAGNGTTSYGINFVVVEVQITQACFNALAVGDMWPPSGDDCDQ
jgi:hypothetical protein